MLREIIKKYETGTRGISEYSPTTRVGKVFHSCPVELLALIPAHLTLLLSYALYIVSPAPFETPEDKDLADQHFHPQLICFCEHGKLFEASCCQI